MPLAAGQSLSFYEILGSLGAGAMGEVYRAMDTRLDREVAIKILPEHFAEDEERLRRFEREAKSLASLNHSNVAQIFGVDQVDDTCFLVLELVPGETLEDRIARGALPIDEALDVCRQIAEGLEAAHDAGVIHRDLKPANVRITPDGKVKVLDFGLAKPSGPDAETESVKDSVLATEAGRLLGTPIYMAPEQARGKPIDRRVDVWAFGCVLFECLTGRRAFDGESMPDVLAAVVHEKANFERLPPSTPAHVRGLLKRCLEKDARQRLRDMGEARIVLLSGEQLDGRGDAAEHSATIAVGKSPWWLAATALAVGGVLALGVVALTGGWSTPEPKPAIRAFLELPTTLELDTVDRAIALSPDGSQVALVAKDTVSGEQRIYLRLLDRLAADPLAGTTGASYPFWSPDGKAIGFFADLKLKRIDLAGGIVRTLCDAPAGRGAAWSRHGFIVFAPSANGALFQVPEEGGEPRTFTTPSFEGESHRLPHFLPDGWGILYTAWGLATTDWSHSSWTPLDEGIAVFAFHPETGAVRKVLDSAREAFFVEPGYLAYLQDSNLMLQPFDPVTLELTGERQPIAAEVYSDWARLFVQLDLVAGGTLAYQETPEMPGMRLGWLDRQGEETPIPAEPLSLAHARVSPDGRRAAIEIDEPNGSNSVVLIDLERGIRTQINPPGSFARYPAWSRDGERLVLQTLIGPHYQLAVIGARPGEAPVAVTQMLGMEQFPVAFTPDDQILFSWRSHVDKNSDLMLVDASGDSPPSPFLADSTNDSDARLSPDGQWLVFATFPAGVDPRTGFEAFEGATLSISDYPTTGRWQITRPDAAVRSWGWLSNREIYWQDSDGRVWVVSITPGDGGGPAIGAPQRLFDEQVFADDGSRIVDYSLAREQFLVARPAGPAPRTRLIVVSDWRAAPR